MSGHRTWIGLLSIVLLAIASGTLCHLSARSRVMALKHRLRQAGIQRPLVGSGAVLPGWVSRNISTVLYQNVQTGPRAITFDPLPKSISDLSFLAEFPELEDVRFCRCLVTPAMIRTLHMLPMLYSFSWQACPKGANTTGILDELAKIPSVKLVTIYAKLPPDEVARFRSVRPDVRLLFHEEKRKPAASSPRADGMAPEG